MAMTTMYPFPSQYHGLTHWKFVLRHCIKLHVSTIPCQETNKYKTNTCSKILFHVYRNVSCFTVHGILPYEERTTCSMCSTDLSSVTPRKLYTQKELVLLETLRSYFQEKYYITVIQNWRSHVWNSPTRSASLEKLEVIIKRKLFIFSRALHNKHASFIEVHG